MRMPKAGGQHPPAKPRLTPDRIVEVGLAQLSERGYEGVTMRSIATALGTGPASLYAHVQNRAELDQLLLEAVLAAVDLPEPSTWRQELTDLLDSLLAAFRRNPGLARTALGSIPATPVALQIAEYMLSRLIDNGVDPQRASWAVDFLLLYVCAVAFELDIVVAAGESDDPDRAALERFFAGLPPEYPTIRAHAPALANGDPLARFDFVVTLVIDALVR